MTLGEKWFRLWAPNGLRWISVLKNHDVIKAGLTKVRARAGLIPIGDADGAVLVWIFDSKPGTTHVLIVRLTEDEANKVHAADPLSVGLIEPVRRHLAAPWAILAVKCGDKIFARPYRISRRYSENRFIAHLDATADTCPAYVVERPEKVLPGVQEAAQEVARDLAFA